VALKDNGNREFPMEEVHKRAVGYAVKKGALMSFDPNLRLQLWEDAGELRQAITGNAGE